MNFARKSLEDTGDLANKVEAGADSGEALRSDSNPPTQGKGGFPSFKHMLIFFLLDSILIAFWYFVILPDLANSPYLNYGQFILMNLAYVWILIIIIIHHVSYEYGKFYKILNMEIKGKSVSFYNPKELINHQYFPKSLYYLNVFFCEGKSMGIAFVVLVLLGFLIA